MATENSFKHFETLWEEAEELAFKLNKNKTADGLIQELKQVTSDLTKLDDLKSKPELSNVTNELKLAFRKKKVGELIFLLAHFAKVQNINVYAELQSEINLSQIELISAQK